MPEIVTNDGIPEGVKEKYGEFLEIPGEGS